MAAWHSNPVNRETLCVWMLDSDPAFISRFLFFFYFSFTGHYLLLCGQWEEKKEEKTSTGSLSKTSHYVRASAGTRKKERNTWPDKKTNEWWFGPSVRLRRLSSFLCKYLRLAASSQLCVRNLLGLGFCRFAALCVHWASTYKKNYNLAQCKDTKIKAWPNFSFTSFLFYSRPLISFS